MPHVKTLLCLRLLLFLALSSGALDAREKGFEGDSLGKISLGQKADTLAELLGKPDAKGKETRWEAIGEWVQEWQFPARGLKLAMSSAKKGGAKTVLSITAAPPCTLTTSRGIQIGSTEAEVVKAYRNERNKEESVPGQTFVAGSVYGGAIFTIKNGKVAGIFIGAAAE